MIIACAFLCQVEESRCGRRMEVSSSDEDSWWTRCGGWGLVVVLFGVVATWRDGPAVCQHDMARDRPGTWLTKISRRVQLSQQGRCTTALPGWSTRDPPPAHGSDRFPIADQCDTRDQGDDAEQGVFACVPAINPLFRMSVPCKDQMTPIAAAGRRQYRATTSFLASH